MRSLLCLIFLICFGSQRAFSLSCSPKALTYKTVSEFVGDQDLIFEGTLKYLDRRMPEAAKVTNPTVWRADRVASFQVDRLYKGPDQDAVNLYYRFNDFGNCGYQYFLKSKPISHGGKFFIIAKENAGFLYIVDSTSSVSSDPLKDQIIDYFNTEKDAMVLLRDGFCFHEIEMAYKYEVFTNSFRIETEACEAYLPVYNKLYRPERD